ncbi:LacI family DNA-binding transcriptional regulator [Mitsuokella multacida]|mgnify:FL=1|jgi:LacI family transcriptional regulator|uniref:LacI family DNA-binding transcriptional regulator n=1 Tax=Mitsuokella multacida TaxID=52226 RepID=UPI0022E0B481|nr:LacI family DNA-binding transcriptional regulator [Mitsuokella multacida]
MPTTLKDIARATGLSTTTVSLVLNGKPHRISKEKCRLIKETAKKMDYHPNRLAVGLIKHETKTVGLILPDITNVFFSEVAKGLEDVLQEHGYHLLLCNSNDRHERELSAIRMMNNQMVDGLIIVMSSETVGEKEKKTFAALKSMKRPVVLIDCFNESGGFSTISIDNFKASYIAVEYLVSLGHRRIACICGPLGLKTNDDRLRGYTAALADSGIPFEKALIYQGDFRYQSGYDAIPVLLPKKPTAVLCLNDMMAYGAMNALTNQGIRVPEDVSVMGFDDIFFSQITSVPLTVIRQPAYDMGKKAGHVLLSALSVHAESQQIVFEPTIRVRKSTKAINNGNGLLGG